MVCRISPATRKVSPELIWSEAAFSIRDDFSLNLCPSHGRSQQRASDAGGGTLQRRRSAQGERTNERYLRRRGRRSSLFGATPSAPASVASSRPSSRSLPLAAREDGARACPSLPRSR